MPYMHKSIRPSAPMPNDTKAKISATKMGHEVTEETRAKIAAGNTGKKYRDYSTDGRSNVTEEKKLTEDRLREIRVIFQNTALQGDDLEQKGTPWPPIVSKLHTAVWDLLNEVRRLRRKEKDIIREAQILYESGDPRTKWAELPGEYRERWYTVARTARDLHN